MATTRMPFDGECITTSRSSSVRMDDFIGPTIRDRFRGDTESSRFEDIALTWPTRQVVLWSDHKQATPLAAMFVEYGG